MAGKDGDQPNNIIRPKWGSNAPIKQPSAPAAEDDNGDLGSPAPVDITSRFRRKPVGSASVDSLEESALGELPDFPRPGDEAPEGIYPMSFNEHDLFNLSETEVFFTQERPIPFLQFIDLITEKESEEANGLIYVPDGLQSIAFQLMLARLNVAAEDLPIASGEKEHPFVREVLRIAWNTAEYYGFEFLKNQLKGIISGRYSALKAGDMLQQFSEGYAAFEDLPQGASYEEVENRIIATRP